MMKPIPFVGCVRLCFILAALSVSLGKFAPCSAQEIDCPRFLPPKNQEWYKPGEIRNIQEILKEKVDKAIRTDDILGNETIAALKKYCMPSGYQLTQQGLEGQRQARKVYENLKQTAPSQNKNELIQLVDGAKKNLPKRFRPFVKILPLNPLDQDPPAPYRIDQKSLGSISHELIPETVLKKLEPLVGFDYLTVDLFDNAIKTIAKITSEDLKDPKRDWEKLHLLAEKEHPLDQSADIRWESGPCGCAPVYKRHVYGFYPYWTPSDETDDTDALPEKATIHYSALSRIGFYALFMGQSGEWRTPEVWKKNRAAFINKARKYRVKVDLVIHNPDWLHATANHSVKIITALTDLVRQTHSCDGVTLYFEEFPAAEEPIQPFKDFLKQLYAASKRSRRPFSINLMLPADSFDKAHKGVRLINFLSIFDKEDDIFVDLLIVFLYEPTSANKKEMRYRIEQKFSGLQRRNVFRKVIPVISPPLYADVQQFKDDLVYFEDNFAGVAFWPMLTGSDNRIDAINKNIRAAYQNANGQAADNPLPGDTTLTDQICAWFCPNRMMMMWIIAAGFLLSVGGALVSIRICAWRAFFQRHFWFVLGVAVLLVILLFGLLSCVPDWGEYSTIVSIAIAAALTLLMVFRQIQRIKKEKYP